jgi:NitT/TauT family transport system permease protein
MTHQSLRLRGKRDDQPFKISMQLKRTLLVVGLVGVGLLAWAALWDKTDWLASPASTWEIFVETIQKPKTYSNLFATAKRLFVGLLLGYTVGVSAAMLMRQSRWWAKFTMPYVYIALSTPGLAWGLISLMVFGLSDLGVYMAVAGVIFPFVTVSLLAGLDSVDAHLTEMTDVYRFSWGDRMIHQAIPEMAPHLFAAFRNVHALAWKIVVLVELFSTQNGIGFQYKRAFAFFSTGRLIVWAAFFVMMVMFVEYGILRPLERTVFRWRA